MPADNGIRSQTTIEKSCMQWNFKDTNLVKLELLSNGTTIDSALHYIRSKQQEQQHKRLDLEFN